MKTILLVSTICLLAGCATAWAASTESYVVMSDSTVLKVEWHCVERTTERVVLSNKGGKYIFYDDCYREEGYREDGIVVWRRSKKILKDAEERERRSLPYKRSQ
jgi:hypothetical protein